ncbi:ribosome rescue protein RqcH [Halobacteriales archaeon Cl-PHB]
MEPKRELTSVDLAALVRELDAYRGARVDKAYLYEDDLVRLKLRDFDHGRLELLVDLGETKHLRLADPAHVPPAPERPPNFAMMLRNRMEGAELVSVEQFEFDRIVSLEFERDDGTTTLVAELFGDGNFAVLDGVGEVVDCLDTVRLKSRTVAPGSQYEYPGARFDPLSVDADGFAARIRESDTDLVRTLATQCNFGGLWGEELCTRAGVPKTVDVADLADDQIAAVFEAVQHLSRRLETDDLDPRVYYEESDGDRRRVDVAPVPLEEHVDLESEVFESFDEAVDDYYTNVRFTAEPEDTGPDRPDFEAQIEKQQRIIDQQEGAIEDFERQAEAEREKAESLYANYDLVDEVLSTVRAARADDVPWDDIAARFEEGAEQGIPEAEAVRRVDGSEGTVTVTVGDHEVTLQVDTGVEKNADRLYREAKRIEEKREGAEEAVAETREQLAEIERRRDEWEAADAGEADDESAQADEDDEDVDWLAEPSIPVRQSEHWYEQFRWFHTSDDFLVIGGRNADQNEDIVKKYLEPGDRFFHTQAHGGPATVLKATGPSESASDDIDIPDRSLEEAAQFAVSYSSIWKAGKYAADVYMVDHDQVSKTPESGEYLEKGGFAIRGDRTYFDDTEVGVAVGIRCDPDTRVIGGPPSAIEGDAATSVRMEPGKYAQNDAAKRLYRVFRERFADESFVRNVASPDLIQEFLPPGGSRIVEE